MYRLLNNCGRERAPYGFRQKLTPFWKPLAAVVVVCIMISGILLTQSSSLQASALRIDILEWLDEFFRNNSHWLSESFVAGVVGFIFFCFTALNWWLSYKLFTRQQVIQPKFRLL